jgi:hypothetical protein
VFADPPAQAASALHDRVRPNHNEGVSPLEQIERRNRASRADAAVLASKRAAAASRALGALQLQAPPAAAPPQAAPVATMPTITPDPAPVVTPPPEQPIVSAPPPTPPPRVERTVTPTSPESAPAPEPVVPRPSGSTQTPLLEVKSSPLSADVEHLGDRLAIFTDHVELRDRLDRVRHSIAGDDIVDVTVQKKLTGAVLTIESVRGEGIVAKGLRADQADEARSLILDKTRPARMASEPVPSTPESPARPAAVAAEPASRAGAPRKRKLDEADLLRKLDDLHQAGVLTAHEYAEKVDLVGRLVRLEELAPSRG